MFFKYFTNHVSEGTYPLIFFAAEPNIYQNNERHDSIVVSHRHSRVELPVVVGEHEGAEQNKSGTCVTDNLEDENGEVFFIQGFIFACVPVKEKNQLEIFFSPYFEHAVG